MGAYLQPARTMSRVSGVPGTALLIIWLDRCEVGVLKTVTCNAAQRRTVISLRKCHLGCSSCPERAIDPDHAFEGHEIHPFLRLRQTPPFDYMGVKSLPINRGEFGKQKSTIIFCSVEHRGEMGDVSSGVHEPHGTIVNIGNAFWQRDILKLEVALVCLEASAVCSGLAVFRCRAFEVDGLAVSDGKGPPSTALPFVEVHSVKVTFASSKRRPPFSSAELCVKSTRTRRFAAFSFAQIAPPIRALFRLNVASRTSSLVWPSAQMPPPALPTVRLQCDSIRPDARVCCIDASAALLRWPRSRRHILHEGCHVPQSDGPVYLCLVPIQGRMPQDHI